MVRTDNDKVLKDGFEAASKIAYQSILASITSSGYRLLQYARQTQEYHNVTGNLAASYAFAVYYDGSIIGSPHFLGDVLPDRGTLDEGESYPIGISKDGTPKYYTGEVKTDRKTGIEKSTAFLISYKPPKNGFAIAFTTGTEYSDFLERIKGLNVFTEVANEARANGANLFSGAVQIPMSLLFDF